MLHFHIDRFQLDFYSEYDKHRNIFKMNSNYDNSKNEAFYSVQHNDTESEIQVQISVLTYKIYQVYFQKDYQRSPIPNFTFFQTPYDFFKYSETPPL